MRIRIYFLLWLLLSPDLKKGGSIWEKEKIADLENVMCPNGRSGVFSMKDPADLIKWLEFDEKTEAASGTKITALLNENLIPDARLAFEIADAV